MEAVSEFAEAEGRVAIFPPLISLHISLARLGRSDALEQAESLQL